MKLFKEIALIAPTASGKTALSIEWADRFNANILSLDSLSIYKEVDIASAKPTLEERSGVRHFGVDEIYPDEKFSVTTFIELYKKAKDESVGEGKNLIIVGGTGFYLKALIYGLSPIPPISKATQRRTNKILEDVEQGYSLLFELDRGYMQNIKPTDRYRVEKMLNLYFETNLTPTEYFRRNPPIPTIEKPIKIYEIETDREILRERIAGRTDKMFEMGLIDEVKYLETKYGRGINPMKAIGVREILDYFDGVYSLDEAREKIIINTARLAKRQRTFNRTQFKTRLPMSLEELKKVEL
jgi:tRNA dimethylallyltransferase